MSTLASRGFEPRADNIQEAFARQAEAINNMANLIVDLQQEVQYLREDQGEKELGLSA